jgi:hypothetical protein
VTNSARTARLESLRSLLSIKGEIAIENIASLD